MATCQGAKGSETPRRSSTQRSNERRGSTATGPLPARTGFRGSPPQVTVLGISGRNHSSRWRRSASTNTARSPLACSAKGALGGWAAANSAVA